jgi:hypothetical protein
MNERHQPCESRLEAISLLATECLTGPEEAKLQNHLADCFACRQRYEEIALICSTVRTAKPVVELERVLAVNRCLQHLRLPTEEVIQKTRLVPKHVAVFATAAMVLVSVVSHLSFRRTDDNPGQPIVIVQALPQLEPADSTDAQLPTLFALRRSAAESDESFDRLLAWYSEPLLLEPLNSHTFSLESWK